MSQGSLTTPQKAFAHHTAVLNLKSVGVWGLRVADFAKHGLNTHADPIVAPAPDPSHAIVDFRALPDVEARKVSQILKAAAEPLYFDATK